MKKKRKTKGFSLTEVLLSVGILAVGMTFIAGVFPVAIYFTTVATERTIAAVAADEAFAKIKLFGGIDPNWLSALTMTDCNNFGELISIDASEFAYPSTDGDITRKQYYWSAICRYIGGRDVQVTVFISRKTGSSTTYQGWAGDWPVPMPVAVSGAPGNEVLTIDESDKRAWINDGHTIVDNETGQLYRVLERYASPDDDTILLDRDWQGANPPVLVWVIPLPVRGGRYPCIAIYQKVIGF